MRFLFILLFLLLLGICTFASKILYKDAIETDMEAKMTKLLEEKGIENVEFEMSEHDAQTLSGQLDSSAGVTVADVEDMTDSIWGAYLPKDHGLTDTPLDPANLYVSRDDQKRVTLRGIVPDEATKANLVAAAENIPDIAGVNDELKIGERIADPAWGAGVTALLPSLYDHASNATLSADRNKVVVTGTVADEEAKGVLTAAVDEIPRGEAAFEPNVTVAPWRDPEYKIARQGEGLVVTGLLPDEPTQSALLASVKQGAGDRPVTDQTTVEPRVHPAWWGDHATKFVPSLFQRSPEDGFIHYRADGITARGTVPDDGAKGELDAIAKAVPGDQKVLTELAVLPPPPAPTPRLVARHSPDEIVLTGLVKTPEESKAIEDGARSAFPDTGITNQINVKGDTEPAVWASAAGALMDPHFKSVRKGVLKIAENSVTLEGETDTKDLRSGVEKAARDGIGEGFGYENLISVVAPVPVPEPVQLVDQLKLLPVYFGSDKDAIDASEVEKIEKAAAAIKNSGSKAGLTVGGYADLRGSAEYNKNLSLRRANAVRDRLVELGVPADVLTVNHFGEDTSKVAKEDLWKSRRVEISLTPLEQ